MFSLDYLGRQLDWLASRVLLGALQHDNADAVVRVRQHIADIEWLMADPTRRAPVCGWKKPYADHDPNCIVCRQHRNKSAG